jgi:Fe-S-cluster containining protein
MAAIAKNKLRPEDLRPGEALCDHCRAKCCKYFALPIENPSSRKEFDYLRWYLLHRQATIFTEDDGWYLLVHTHCKHLQPDERCDAYETRPQICRGYSTKDCEYDDQYVYDHYFETAEQVEEYVEAVLPAKDPRKFRSPRPSLLPVIG